MSKKNANDIIVNRTHDLPACSAVPQPTGAITDLQLKTCGHRDRPVHYLLCKCTFHSPETGGRFGKQVHNPVNEREIETE
jgi:hypothetical protein